MIIFNEGLPGSGKSYDAVVTHILPALKKGRQVYARVNGLDYAAIAAYLDMPLQRVSDLLHHVTAEEVPNLPRLEVKDALILVDEAHDFYVSSREAVAKDQESMFAEHRHRGWDIVLMSQFYKRIHRSVRARIQRKAVFRKMDMVGADGKYVVKHYAAIEPEKYEAVGTETKSYDPAIFPLYKSVQEGTQNFEVYDAGKFTIWDKLRKYAIVMVPLGLWACWYLYDWFQHPPTFLKDSKHAPGAPVMQNAPAGHVADGTLDTNRKRGIDTAGMPAEIAYVFDLANQGRARLGAIAQTEDGRRFGLVEFRDSQSHVLDRLSLQQLAALGVTLVYQDYGVRIGWQKAAFIATPWPLDLPGRVSDAQGQEIDAHPLRRSDAWMQNSLPSDSEPESFASSSDGGPAEQRPHGSGAFLAGPTVNPSGRIGSTVGRH